jgi:hypothetical protein
MTPDTYRRYGLCVVKNGNDTFSNIFSADYLISNDLSAYKSPETYILSSYLSRNFPRFDHHSEPAGTRSSFSWFECSLMQASAEGTAVPSKTRFNSCMIACILSVIKCRQKVNVMFVFQPCHRMARFLMLPLRLYIWLIDFGSSWTTSSG